MATLNTQQRKLRTEAIRVIKATGVCATVNGAETGRAGARNRGQRPHAMVVLGSGQAAPEAGGLATTGWRQLVVVRLESPMPQSGNRQQAEETRLEDTFAEAVATLIDAFHAEIDLIDDDSIEFDPAGWGGVVLGMTTGYVTRDNTFMRTAQLSLPFILYDMWTQAR